MRQRKPAQRAAIFSLQIFMNNSLFCITGESHGPGPGSSPRVGIPVGPELQEQHHVSPQEQEQQVQQDSVGRTPRPGQRRRGWPGGQSQRLGRSANLRLRQKPQHVQPA